MPKSSLSSSRPSQELSLEVSGPSSSSAPTLNLEKVRNDVKLDHLARVPHDIDDRTETTLTTSYQLK